MHEGQYMEALEYLDAAAPEEVEALYYRYSPNLIVHCPDQLLESWKRWRKEAVDPKSGRRHMAYLSTKMLLPALMQYQPPPPALHDKGGDGRASDGGGGDPAPVKRAPRNRAILYLNYAIKKQHCTDACVHNFLLSMLAKDGNNDADLLAFLQDDDPRYDRECALRTCITHARHACCVHLYFGMGLHEEAVGLALNKVDLALAQSCAERVPEEDEALRKTLWLMIARHVISATDAAEGGVQRFIQLLQKCPLLRIEDVLPYFPDFVRIGEFKDEICESLESYNKQVKGGLEINSLATASAVLSSY
jgi:hypothetical protein